MDVRRKLFTAVKDLGGGAIEVEASNEGEDRDRDIMRASGWITDNYRKNPVVLWAHEYRELPVAKTTDISVTDDALIARLQFADHDKAQDIYNLYAGGYLNAVSVGFVPLEWTPREKGGRDYTKQELLEISCVPVPSNPTALQRAMEKGLNVDVLDDAAEGDAVIDSAEGAEGKGDEGTDALIDADVMADALTGQDIERLTEALALIQSVIDGADVEPVPEVEPVEAAAPPDVPTKRKSAFPLTPEQVAAIAARSAAEYVSRLRGRIDE